MILQKILVFADHRTRCNDKNQKESDKIGPPAPKIRYTGIILTVFDPKNTFPTSVRVRNITFELFLQIFGNLQKK